MKKLSFLRLPRGVSLFWLPVFAAIWLVQSCGCQEKEAIFRSCGNVVEFGTNKPIPNAKVTFSDYGGGGGGSNITTSATLDADLEGHFCYEGRTSIISAEANGYYPSSDDFVFIRTNAFDDYKVALYPEAWISVTYINQSGVFGITVIDSEFFNRLLQMQKGEMFTVMAKLKGNRAQSLIYSVYSAPDKIVPELDAAKVTTNSQSAQPISNGFGSSFVEFIPIGHDTTHIQIIF